MMTTTTTPATSESTADVAEPRSRQRLTDAVQSLVTRASRADADRLLRLSGPVLIPVGAILILLGWYGAANTTRVFLQIPYLISGGLLGLGLMFAGGFAYFARWLTDLLDATRRQASEAHATAERTALALERIEARFRDGGHLAAPNPVSAQPASGAPDLVATAKGSMAHSPRCRLVQGRDVHAVAPGEALDRCRICRQ